MDTLNRVSRLWGRIKGDLKKEELLLLRVDNTYQQSYFNGKKRLVLQEVNELGGCNDVLGLIFIFSAALIICIQLAFLLLYVVRIANYPGGSAQFYNPDNLTW